ncbi:MAG TPA: class I SAM-dependent methyltransferase, partial [Alphaproteobacteria bacterium]|nr:class I SAM-dependent methyltransferase [Alphaproteobacteria bacterium]
MIRKLLRLLPLPVKRFGKRILGDRFQNDGGINDADFDVIRKDIDRVRPSVFIEIGTGVGISARKIFAYLKAQGRPFDFYSIDIFKGHLKVANAAMPDANFHPVWGLSVTVDETDEPARSTLAGYDGPQNVLRNIINTDLAGKTVDIAFIDSAKGSALPEFKVLAEHMTPNGAIFCHDITNGDKGVEVL